MREKGWGAENTTYLPPFTATSSPGHKPRDVLGPHNEAPTGLLQVSPSERFCSSPQILPIFFLTQVLFKKNMSVQ